MDQGPIAAAALGILLAFSWIIERELDVVEGTQLVICEHSRAVTVRGDGELHLLRAEVSQNLSELRVHSVLTGAQIHGADRQAFHHRSHLLEAKPVGPRLIAVAEGTSQVTLVGKPKSECKPVGRSRSDQL